MSTYGNVVTTFFKQREAAALAGGTPVQFKTFAVGDGNGTVPALSSAGVGLVNERYRAAVNTVVVNPTNPAQVDISCALPFQDAAGNPLGGFFVREVAVFDENGAQVVAGITQFEKTTAAEGQDSSFNYIVSIVVGDVNAVVISTPDGAFATTADINSIEANMADLLALITFEGRGRLALESHARATAERTFQNGQRLLAANL